MREELGDIVNAPGVPLLGPENRYLIFHPQYARYVLSDNKDNYIKGIAWKELKLYFGEGLIVKDGPEWQSMRSRDSEAFQSKYSNHYIRLAGDVTLEMMERWRSPSRQDRSFDLEGELRHLVFELIQRTLFGRDMPPDLIDEMLRDIVLMEKYVTKLFLAFPNHALLSRIVFLPWELQFRGVRRKTRRILDRWIEEAEHAEGRKGTLLPLLLQNLPEGHDDRAHDDMRDEILTYLIAATEPAALTLMWSWILLSQNPEARARLDQEAKAAFEGEPSVKDLHHLRYATAVIKESLRLYPPAGLVVKEAKEDDEIGGCRIPKGSFVYLFPYVIHRHPDFWEDPEKFNPDRFYKKGSEETDPYAFIPFSIGERSCMGRGFTFVILPIILGLIAKHRGIELLAGQKIEGMQSINLRLRNPLRARLGL